MANSKTVKGTVKWFNDAKGYGFLQVDPNTLLGGLTNQDVFVHYSALSDDGFKTLAEGQQVEFDLVDGPKGPQATNVIKLKS